MNYEGMLLHLLDLVALILRTLNIPKISIQSPSRSMFIFHCRNQIEW